MNQMPLWVAAAVGFSLVFLLIFSSMVLVFVARTQHRPAQPVAKLQADELISQLKENFALIASFQGKIVQLAGPIEWIQRRPDGHFAVHFHDEKLRSNKLFAYFRKAADVKGVKPGDIVTVLGEMYIYRDDVQLVECRIVK